MAILLQVGRAATRYIGTHRYDRAGSSSRSAVSAVSLADLALLEPVPGADSDPPSALSLVPSLSFSVFHGHVCSSVRSLAFPVELKHGHHRTVKSSHG